MSDGIANDVAGPCDATDTAPVPTYAWPLTERPGFLARRLHQIHVSLFSERCAAFRITPLQFSLLSLLRELEEADQTTLANAVALDRTTTTGALKRLAARKLVSRSTSLADRRAQVCRITAEGKALHAAMEHAAIEAHALTISALGAEDQSLLVGLLKRVVIGHDNRFGRLDLG